MKTSTFVGYLTVFIGAVLIGYWIGFHLTAPAQGSPETTPKPTSSLPERQQTLLVIHIDRIHAHPKLRIIWLAAIKPGSGYKLVPIYPITRPLSVNDRHIVQAFSLEKDFGRWKPAESFFQTLHSKGLEWNGFVVLDDLALASLAKTTGEIRINGQVLDQDDPTPSWMEKDDYAFQLKFWQNLCWNIVNSPQKIELLKGDFVRHILVGTTPGTSIDWQSLISNVEVPLCEFPYQLTASR